MPGEGALLMAIEKINRINNVAAPATVSNTSKNLQTQLMMKQQNLNKLANDSKLGADEKEKKLQELQKEIEELKRRLAQMRRNQEEAEKAAKAKQTQDIDLEKAAETESQKEENNTSAVEKTEEVKKERVELSAKEVQEMLDTKFELKQEMIQQGAEYDKQNTIRVLSSEIKQDEIYGTNTTSKEAELKELQTKENFWVEAQNEAKQPEVTPLINPDMKVILE